MAMQTAKNGKNLRTGKNGNGKLQTTRNGDGKTGRAVKASLAEPKADTKKQRRDRLMDERTDAETELVRLRDQMQIEIEHDSDEGDPDVYEREKLLAVIRTIEDKIESIDDALKALDHGNYGICVRCGTQIGVERLKAVPGTTLCVKCKAETEKMLKRGFTPE